jgi:hypothetical protein
MAVADAPSAAIAIRCSHQLLQDKDCTSYRRVKCGAKTRTGPSHNQHSAVRPASAEYLPHKVGQARPHLNTGAFAAKRQAGADGKQPTEELHRDQSKRGLRKLPAHNGLDVRNTASRRMRRVEPNQPGGKPSRACARRNNEQEAHNLITMSPSYDCIAQVIRMVKGEAEDRSDKSRKRTRNQRE